MNDIFKKETKLFNWIGGKNWLSKSLALEIKKFKNNNIEIYAEPFCGGLGSFIPLLPHLDKIGIKEFHLNDINQALINTYKQIKNNPLEVIQAYFEIEKKYIKTIPQKAYNLHKTKDKLELKKLLSKSNDFFIKRRNQFNKNKNKNTVFSAALFLFITQHNFNGVYRENSKGEFNIPYNWETKKINFEKRESTILYYSKIFNQYNIIFHNLNCFEFLDFLPKEKTLVYLDPPYINEKANENKYNKDCFSKDIQIQLLNFSNTFNYFLLSNHTHKIFKDFTKEHKLKFKTFYRRNNISQKSETRKDLKSEILIIKK